MRMKELSSVTGISDRTIRYYIDEVLFVPEGYTENYAGRKNFDFTENDVEKLKQIALLRKYDFPTKTIKDLRERKFNISDILEKHINESRENLDEKSDNVVALESAVENNPRNFDELCELLSNPDIDKEPVPTDGGNKVTFWSDAKLVLRALGIIGLWVLVFAFSNENRVSKYVYLLGTFLIPLILDTVAFVLEITGKRGVVRAVSIGLRIAMAAIFIFSIYNASGVKRDQVYQIKEKKLFSSIKGEALVGIPEDENTVYSVNFYGETNTRPEPKNSSFISMGNLYGFVQHLEMELQVPYKDYTGTLEVRLEYYDNIKVFPNWFYSTSCRDVKRSVSNYNERNWETYETDDGYKFFCAF